MFAIYMIEPKPYILSPTFPFERTLMKKTWLRSSLCVASLSAFYLSGGIPSSQAQDEKPAEDKVEQRIIVLSGDHDAKPIKIVGNKQLLLTTSEDGQHGSLRVNVSKDGRIVWHSKDDGESSAADTAKLHQHLMLLKADDEGQPKTYQLKLASPDGEKEHRVIRLELKGDEAKTLDLNIDPEELHGDIEKHMEKIHLHLKEQGEGGHQIIELKPQDGERHVERIETADGKQMIIVTQKSDQESDSAADKVEKRIRIHKVIEGVHNKDMNVEVEEIELGEGDEKQIVVVVRGDQAEVEKVISASEAKKPQRVQYHAEFVPADKDGEKTFMMRFEPSVDGSRIRLPAELKEDVLLWKFDDGDSKDGRRFQIRVRPEVEMKWHEKEESPSDQKTGDSTSAGGSARYEVIKNKDGNVFIVRGHGTEGAAIEAHAIEGRVIGTDAEHTVIDGMHRIRLRQVESEKDGEKPHIRYEVQKVEEEKNNPSVEERLKSLEKRIQGLERRLRAMNSRQ